MIALDASVVVELLTNGGLAESLKRDLAAREAHNRTMKMRTCKEPAERVRNRFLTVAAR